MTKKQVNKQAKTAEQIHFEMVEAIARTQPILAHGVVVIPEKAWNNLIKVVGQLRDSNH